MAVGGMEKEWIEFKIQLWLWKLIASFSNFIARLWENRNALVEIYYSIEY